ncbi:MAG: DEAD/DEAH box helicase family protein [Acidimicrobiales bacterium]
MALASSEPAASSVLPPVGDGQSHANRVEQVLVHHLLESLVDDLTDRRGTVHTFPWSPDQEVRIGVLGPTFIPQQPQGPGSGPPGTAGTMGTAGSAAADDDGDGGDDAGGGPRPVVAPPVENRGVTGVDFIVAGGVPEVELEVGVDYALYHPLIPPFGAVSAEAQRRAGAAGGNSRRRPRVPVSPSWTRDNRSVSFQIRVPVDTAEVDLSSQQIPGGDPLEADARAAVAAHYATPDALWKLKSNQTLAVADAMGTEAQYRQALVSRRDADWQPDWPLPRLTVTTMPTPNGEVGVSVSITNGRQLTDRPLQDLSVYDTRMTVTVVEPGSLLPQRLGFAADDVRYTEAATVVGRGRGCVATAGSTPSAVVAETLPVHIQHVSETMTHGIDISFSRLATDYRQAVDAIGSAMRSFLRSWDLSGATTLEERRQLLDLRDAFKREVERFELGSDLLSADPRLDKSFKLANQAFARAKGAAAAWRLFQLVFIVTELGALAGREDPTNIRLRSELNAVDVLWFPTGGGKTEAYLGLIVVALFFDRLRDKLRGTSAWLLFPLRMLSVQQLARIGEVIYHAENLRTDEDIAGDPFALGYLVGSGNTPNRLAAADSNGWWPGIQTFAGLLAEERDTRRLVGACPACGNPNSVGLDTDVPGQRLLHVCRNGSCGFVLPIYASDEEVTRYQPAVIVSTVDKITAFSRNGELTSFNHGPQMQCPDHGWYTHAGCVVPSCSTDVNTHTHPSGFRDSTPSLWIQDELHLVREELGVFAGHYHTLLAELAAGAGHEPSKVIAGAFQGDRGDRHHRAVRRPARPGLRTQPAPLPGGRPDPAEVLLQRNHRRRASHLPRPPPRRRRHSQGRPGRGRHREADRGGPPPHRRSESAALGAGGRGPDPHPGRSTRPAVHLRADPLLRQRQGARNGRPRRHPPAIR